MLSVDHNCLLVDKSQGGNNPYSDAIPRTEAVEESAEAFVEGSSVCYKTAEISYKNRRSVSVSYTHLDVYKRQA